MINKRNTEKLDSRTEVCLFIGYPKSTRGGIFNNARDKKVFVLTHATFLENEYMNDFKPHSKLLLEEISEKKIPDDLTRVVEKVTNSVTTRVVDIDNETENITGRKVIIPRHSEKIKRPLERYEANIVVPDTNDEDPSTYEDAMMDTDREKWHEAMNQEIESMYFNSV